ncbi:MAG: hypothetical protein Fur0018_07910 [Anaerolineales bacterium]
MNTKVIVNGFPKGGTNLLASLLDLLGFSQARGAIASSLLTGRFSWARQAFWGSKKPKNMVLTGIDFPVAIHTKRLETHLKKLAPMTYMTAHSMYSGHLEHIFSQAGAKMMQIIRDPRDIVVSHAVYCAKNPAHPLFAFYGSPVFNGKLAQKRPKRANERIGNCDSHIRVD